MNEDENIKRSKRRHRTKDQTTSRTTGEEARAIPSMSIPGFSHQELSSMADKLRLLNLVMEDWSPISRRLDKNRSNDINELNDKPEDKS